MVIKTKSMYIFGDADTWMLHEQKMSPALTTVRHIMSSCIEYLKTLNIKELLL